MSERLSEWETEQILKNGGEPDSSWAWRMPKLKLLRYGIYVYEAIPTKAPGYAHAHWCLAATIQLLRPWGEFHEFDRVDMTSRTWPTTHFVRYHGLWYAVRGGSAIHDGRWWIRWRAWRNEPLAQHLNGYHYEGDQERCCFCLAKLARREIEIMPWPKPRTIALCAADATA